MRHLPLSIDEVRKVFEHAQGCGDNSCNWVKPHGMATNGGCRCFDKRPLQVLVTDLAFLALELAAAIRARGQEPGDE
jgi:hypothetical protein